MGSVNTHYKLTFNKKEIYYLKIVEQVNEAELKNEIRIFQNFAAEKSKLDFCFPTPLKTKNNKLYIRFRNRFAQVFTEVPGRSIYKALSTPQVKTIGMKLTQLHKIKANPTLKPHPFNLKGMKKVFKQISAITKKKKPDLHKFISNTLHELDVTQPNLKKHVLIHGDLFPENILWNGNRFSGMIDFECAGLGEPMFDISVCLHSFCHNEKSFDQKKVTSFIKGYSSIRKITKQEQKHFIYYMKLTSLRFMLTRLRNSEFLKVKTNAKHYKNYREYLIRFNEINRLQF